MPNTNIFDFKPKYIIFMNKLDAEKWQDEDIKLTHKFTCPYSDDYIFAEVSLSEEALRSLEDYGTEDILYCTGAYAIHEEYTTGVIIKEEFLEEISEVYCWDGAGNAFIGDMLTDVERLGAIMLNHYNKTKKRLEIKDLFYKVDKDSKDKKPIEDDISVLYDSKISRICIDDVDIPYWMPTFIEDLGYNIIIIEDMETLFDVNDYEDDYVWGQFEDEYDNDYHYIDDYYRKKGLL